MCELKFGTKGTNLCALLDTIAYAEIGPDLLASPEGHNGYRILVGSTAASPLIFTSYADHPLMGRAIEYADGVYSSAAGRYQILNTYWPHYKSQLWLTDFSPKYQDEYAIQQIREQCAMEPILAGKFHEAVHLLSNIWASLPGEGNTYGQRIVSIEDLEQVYRREGGIVA